MSDRPPGNLFSPAELTLFRYTTVLFAAVVMAGLVVLIVWILAQLVSIFYGILLPLSVAGVLALVLSPVVDLLEQRLSLRRATAVVLLFLAVILVVAVGLTVVLPTAVEQLARFSDDAPGIFNRWQQQFATRFPDITAMIAARMEEDHLRELLPEMEDARQRIMSYLGTLVGLGFVPLFLFFALIAGERMQRPFLEALRILREDTQRDIIYLGRVFIDYVTGFFRGQLIIAMVMGALLGLGFTLVGLQAAIIFGVLLGLLNIVPYLGTIVGLVTVLPFAYLQPDGGLQLVAWVLLVFAVVQLLESWVLTPKIMADRSGLHPAVVVISIFFWGTALGGVIGMILAVPLTAFVITLWKHLNHRFMSNVVVGQHPASQADQTPPDQ